MDVQRPGSATHLFSFSLVSPSQCKNLTKRFHCGSTHATFSDLLHTKRHVEKDPIDDYDGDSAVEH